MEKWVYNRTTHTHTHTHTHNIFDNTQYTHTYIHIDTCSEEIVELGTVER
jgi:hypothetical protein